MHIHKRVSTSKKVIMGSKGPPASNFCINKKISHLPHPISHPVPPTCNPPVRVEGPCGRAAFFMMKVYLSMGFSTPRQGLSSNENNRQNLFKIIGHPSKVQMRCQAISASTVNHQWHADSFQISPQFYVTETATIFGLSSLSSSFIYKLIPWFALWHSDGKKWQQQWQQWQLGWEAHSNARFIFHYPASDVQDLLALKQTQTTWRRDQLSQFSSTVCRWGTNRWVNTKM